MPFERPDRRVRSAPASGQRAVATLLAFLVLAIAVTPVLAVSPTPTPTVDPGASQTPTPPPIPTPNPCLTPPPPPPPTPPPTSTPQPSATPDPNATPTDTPLPTDTPVPTDTPQPTVTPTPVICPPPTPAWSTAVTVVGNHIRFWGRGSGHGVGMSQYGARARALAGQTMEQIIAAYFGGAVTAAIDPSREIRVLLISSITATSAKPLVIHGRLGPWTIDGISKVFPADAVLKAWRGYKKVKGVMKPVWFLRVIAPNGKTVLASKTAGSFAIVRPADPATRLDLDSKGSSLDRYRGRLTLYFGSPTVRVVNTLGIDDYLRGVVPAEMSYKWPLEAVRAQTVVARSFAVTHLHTGGQFDVYDDSRSQVYEGVYGERSITNTFISMAPGLVAKAGSKIVGGYYSSDAGGWTESNIYAWVSPTGIVSSKQVAYLRGVDDRAYDGRPYDIASPSYNWHTPLLTHAQLDKILGADSRTACGSVIRLDLTHRGMSGRLYRVVIYGTLGRRTVSGDVFRTVYNAHRPAGSAMLRSNLFDAAPLP